MPARGLEKEFSVSACMGTPFPPYGFIFPDTCKAVPCFSRNRCAPHVIGHGKTPNSCKIFKFNYKLTISEGVIY